MPNYIFENSGIHETGVPPSQQSRRGRHPATAKEVNKVVMECFYRSKPFHEDEKPIR